MIIITDSFKCNARYCHVYQGWQWAYMGKDNLKRDKIAAILGSDKRYKYADELKKISYHYKQRFLDWVARICKQYSRPLFWWTTRLASKSTLQTDFYLLFCYLVLLKKWSKEGKHGLIIIIEDPFLLKAAQYNLESRNVFFESSKLFYIMKYTFLIFRSVLVPLYFFLEYSLYYLLNFFFKIKYKNQLLSDIDVLIHTWIEHRSFKQGNDFSDSYFGNLYSLFREHGYKTCTLSQFKLDKKLLKKSYQSKNILPLSSFMTFESFFTKICLFNCNQPPLDSMDLKFLMKRESLKERASTTSKRYYLYYQAYRRFCRFVEDGNLKAIVYPFENQPWEKAMLLAFKEENVSFKTVGYQHSSIPELLLLYDLGKDELSNIPLPSMILTNGQHNEKYLKKAGFPAVYNGGSLRYQYKQFKEGVAEDNILLLCPSSIEHALALIYYGIRKLSKGSQRILIKLHPDVSKKRIMYYIKRFPSQMNFVNGSLLDLQNKFNTVIHTGSTAAIECLAMAKKVYKLKTELLDIDPLDNLTKQNELDESMDLNLCQYSNYSVNIDSLYENVKKSVWLNILK